MQKLLLLEDDLSLIDGLTYSLKKNEFEYMTTPGFMWYPGLARQSYISTKLNRAIVKGIRMVDE